MTGQAVFIKAAAATILIFVSAGGCATAQPAPGSDSGQVLIRLKGKVGETFRTEIQSELWSDTAADGQTVLSGTSNIVDFNSTTEEVRPNGSTVEATTVARVRQEMLGPGKHFSFDSSDPSALAADNPATRRARLLLQAKMRTERDDRGRVIDMSLITGDAAADAAVGLKASDMMASDAVILPDGPVRIGDSWEAQHREIPMAGIGRLNFVLVATLKQVIVRGDETRLLLTFTARDPVFTAATTGQMTASLKSFEVTSENEFSLDQGRFLFMEETDALKISLSDPARDTADIDVIVHTSDRDRGGAFAAWVVQPGLSILTPERRASVAGPTRGLSPDQAACFVEEGPTGPPDQRIAVCATVLAATNDKAIMFQAHVGRAEAYFQLQRYGEAIADLTAALALRPDAEPTLRDRAELERVKGDLPAALADADTALRLNPKDAEAYVVRGMTRARQRDVVNAMRDAEAAVKINPNLANAYFLRGHLRIDAGDKDGGKADIEAYQRLKGTQ